MPGDDAVPGGGWAPSSPVPAWLPDSEVHVWRAAVPASPEALTGLESLLSPRARARAARLASPGARARYVTARAATATVLGGLLGVPAAAVETTRRRAPDGTAYGKPAIAGFADLDFSVSHSGRLAVLAVARGRAIGVDVERRRPHMDVLGVARQALAPEEAAEIAALPGPERGIAFLRCWTRKEAYLKGLGVGLPGRLREWSVSTGGEAETALGDWRLHSLAPAEGYVGAVAVEGEARLRRFDLALGGTGGPTGVGRSARAAKSNLRSPAAGLASGAG